MLSFPNCKINLGLRILRRRGDGYHDLETVFYPLAVKDALESIRSETLNFTSTGLPIPGEASSNLCLKAWQLLKKDFPQLPAIHIHLHKNIPIGAGLGGGSADGAFMLRLLDRQFGLQLSTEKFMSYAGQLGSDCPFFILNNPCLAGGRGEKLEPILLDLSSYRLALVNPGIHIGTAWAFSQCTPSSEGPSIREIIAEPINTWREQLVNDFEAPVCRAHPELKKIKEKLYQAGAIYASMTGSGSSFFGIFAKDSLPSVVDTADMPGFRLT
ncbi:MAG: 4-(cytidine 5'-diphospho)-2-C-methyl-D-erythritol kinase [Chitinophagaceae bacterium]|nr:4-(cytidine 5'-diphospho)-2-C-methyl-D-erythritol kinase [Chitinophagaceae bacterium]